MTGIVEPSGTTTNTYDVLGNRVSQTVNGQTTNFMFDPMGLGDVVATFNGAGALTAHYTYGLGLVSQVSPVGTGRLLRFQQHRLDRGRYGHVGDVRESVRVFAVWPDDHSRDGPRHSFTFVGALGVQNDGGGFYNMRAREYDAATGQFMSSDPLGIDGGSDNVRSYAQNRPTSDMDASGLTALARRSNYSAAVWMEPLLESRYPDLRPFRPIGSYRTHRHRSCQMAFNKSRQRHQSRRRRAPGRFAMS